MKPIRIFRHVGCEGPVYLGTLLDRHAVPYELVCIDAGVAVPHGLDDISGLVFMGGVMNVTDFSRSHTKHDGKSRNQICC